jgi:hypothetical protein
MYTKKSNPLVLDRRLSASQARASPEVKHIQSGMLKEAAVRVHQKYFYRVDFGPDVRPQVHIVSYDLFCTCPLEEDCPAVTAVKVYLQKETRVEEPRKGYFPTVPHRCPACGARSHYEPRLTSKNRGLGWRCEKGGAACYWKHQAQAIRAAYAEKWKRLGVDPGSLRTPACFAFQDGYDPERVFPISFSECMLSRP